MEIRHKWGHPISNYPIINYGDYINPITKQIGYIVAYRGNATILKSDYINLLKTYNKKTSNVFEGNGFNLIGGSSIFDCRYVMWNARYKPSNSKSTYDGRFTIYFNWNLGEEYGDEGRYYVRFERFGKNGQRYGEIVNCFHYLREAVKWCRQYRSNTPMADQIVYEKELIMPEVRNTIVFSPKFDEKTKTNE